MENLIQSKAINMVQTVGRSVVSSFYPNDFEVYFCALELCNSDDETIDYFAFPINPSSIIKREPKKTLVQKTLSGTTVLFNPSFIPYELTLVGNFGRSFKMLVNTPGLAYSLSTTDSSLGVSSGVYSLYQLNNKITSENGSLMSFTSPSFDLNVKTGYGCIKILQAILSKSSGVDSTGKPLRLYFYNMALGENYQVVVPPNGFTLTQNQNKNMIWEYTINLTAIRPIEGSSKSNTRSLILKTLSSNVQQGVTSLAKTITSLR